MKQAFQFDRDEFCELTSQLIKINKPSFSSREAIHDSILNCLIAIGGKDKIEVDNIHFLVFGDQASNANHTLTDIHFTLVKKAATDENEFLQLISRFNIAY